MMKILFIIFFLFPLPLLAQEDDSALTYEIDDTFLSNSSPDSNKLDAEMNELGENLDLKSEEDLKLIVDSYQPAPIPQDEVSENYQDEVTDEYQPEEMVEAPPVESREQIGQNELQDKAQLEQSSISKMNQASNLANSSGVFTENPPATQTIDQKMKPDESPSEANSNTQVGQMIEGDVMDRPLENQSSPDQTYNSPMTQEDKINFAQAAPVRTLSNVSKASSEKQEVFEFPEKKKDSFFPIMELPKTRKIRSR